MLTTSFPGSGFAFIPPGLTSPVAPGIVPAVTTPATALPKFPLAAPAPSQSPAPSPTTPLSAPSNETPPEKPQSEQPMALFGSKRTYELWKSTEHLFSYMVGNSMASVAHYYYRAVNPALKDVFLYNQNHPVGQTVANVLIPSEMRPRLQDDAVDFFLTHRANELDNISSGIKMFFQIPNLIMNTMIARRTTNDKTLVLASTGNAIRSVTYLAEKAAIISAGALYNSGHHSIALPFGLQWDALTALTVSHVAIIIGALLHTPMSLPFLMKEAKKEDGIGGIFMESLNALGASAGNILMSGATLYFYAQNSGTGSYDDLYKILKQSFEFRDTLLYVNMGIMMTVSGISLVGHLKRFNQAVKENDTERKYIVAPLIGAAVFGLAAAPFMANPATLPLALALYTGSSLFFISSMVIKHRKFLNQLLHQKVIKSMVDLKNDLTRPPSANDIESRVYDNTHEEASKAEKSVDTRISEDNAEKK